MPRHRRATWWVLTGNTARGLRAVPCFLGCPAAFTLPQASAVPRCLAGTPRGAFPLPPAAGGPQLPAATGGWGGPGASPPRCQAPSSTRAVACGEGAKARQAPGTQQRSPGRAPSTGPPGWRACPGEQRPHPPRGDLVRPAHPRQHGPARVRPPSLPCAAPPHPGEDGGAGGGVEPAGRALAREQRDGGTGGQTPCRSPARGPGRVELS